MAIATCVKAQFILSTSSPGHGTDQGLIEGQAHHLLRYRRELGSDVKILADASKARAAFGLPQSPLPCKTRLSAVWQTL